MQTRSEGSRVRCIIFTNECGTKGFRHAYRYPFGERCPQAIGLAVARYPFNRSIKATTCLEEIDRSIKVASHGVLRP